MTPGMLQLRRHICHLLSAGLATAGRRACSTASLRADPQVCMHDVHTSLILRGLPAGAAVTLRAETVNDNDKKFCSHGHYVSSPGGEVMLDTAPSVGGSYTGVFPAGLLTTLAPPPEEFPFRRLYKKDPAIPWQITISAYMGHHAVASTVPSAPVSSVTLTRYMMAPGVTRRRVRDGRVRGVMYLPPSHYGPAVGVVDMFGAVGGIMEFRAAMLASRGYAVLALPFFGYEDLPAVPATLELEYFEEAVQFVMAQDNVIPDRCGMISVSKSTDIALILSTKMAALTAVACIGPVSVSYDTDLLYRGKMLVQGIKLSADKMLIDDMGRIQPNPEFIKKFNAEPLALQEASPECHYLLAAGDEDTWMCHHCIKHLVDHMDAHNLSDKIDSIIYPGVGHIIEPPFGPLLHRSYQRVLPVHKAIMLGNSAPKSDAADEDIPGGKVHGDNYITGVPILFGGKPKQTCDAQVDLWDRIQKFLDRRVKDSSPWYQQYLLNAKPPSKL